MRHVGVGVGEVKMSPEESSSGHVSARHRSACGSSGSLSSGVASEAQPVSPSPDWCEQIKDSLGREGQPSFRLKSNKRTRKMPLFQTWLTSPTILDLGIFALQAERPPSARGPLLPRAP